MKNSKTRLPFIMMFFLLWLFSFRVFPDAGKGFILSDDLTYEFITHNAEYLVDNKELLTIRDIVSPEYSGLFQEINSGGFLSKENRVVWLRFSLENTTNSVNEWYLEHDYFKHNIEFNLYIPGDGDEFMIKRVYPGVHPPELDLAYRNYVLKIPIPPDEKKTIFLKATVSSDLYLVLKIWHPVVFQNTIRAEQLFIGVFLGIMFIMAFYNFFLFLSFKDSSYIFYILFILSLSVLQLNNHHIISEWIIQLGKYDHLITTIFKLLSFICFLSFSRSFLSIKKYFPLLDKVLIGIIYVVIGLGLLSFSFDVFKVITNIFLAIPGILVMTLSIIILIRGNRTALFFLIAMVSLIGFGVLVLIPAESFYIKSINFFVPFFIDIGSLLMIVLFSFGLGYRIKMLQKEKDQVHRLKELNSVKSRFFANISHEFRTPLTLISGPLEDMLSECSDPGQKKKYEMMIRNSGRLLRLVNQLLDLSKLESGKMKVSAFKQNIVIFVKGLVKCFGYITEQNQQTLSFHAEPGEILIYFDQEKIEKIFLNLLINAIKFTPPGGEIIVNITKNDKGESFKEFPEGYTQVIISNPGPGIPPAHLEHIFDHFYQVENIREYAHKGSGLGLAVVKEMVKLHHGSIDVKSSIEEPDEQNHTVFTIRLPLGNRHFKSHEIVQTSPIARNFKINQQIRDMCMQEASIEESDIELQDTAQEKHQKDIIIVIEDNAEVREYLREGLIKDFQVIEAINGEDGIKKARKIIPDLIICDVMMPGIDGYQVTHTLKSRIDTSHIPVILLTAKASEESIIQGLEFGADDYITKPFNLKIVRARIMNLIKLRHSLQEKHQKQMLLQPSELSIESLDQKFLHNLQEIIEKNIANQDFTIEILAKSLYMSKATLNRKIRALTGQSSNQYIQSYRLKKAVQLLKSNSGNITEICYAVGFSNSAYFTKCFKKAFHQLPSQFQAIKTS